MKFKKLLWESQKEEVLKKIETLLQSRFRNEPELLYRGTNDDVDTFEIRDIRKNRKPRDTMKSIHCLVGAMEDEFYPDVPKRSESKFATPSAQSASGYGVNRLIVFPEKGADVYSSNFDPTTTFFHDSYKHLDSLLESLTLDETIKNLREGGYEELSKWIQKLLDYETEEISYSEFCQYTNNNIREIYDQSRNLERKYGGSSSIRAVFDYIEDYFHSMDQNIAKRDLEVIFNGDKYLVVDEDLFEENFSWAGRWMRK